MSAPVSDPKPKSPAEQLDDAFSRMRDAAPKVGNDPAADRDYRLADIDARHILARTALSAQSERRRTIDLLEQIHIALKARR